MAIFTYPGIEQPYEGLDRQEPALSKAGWTRTHDDDGQPVGDQQADGQSGPADEHVAASDHVAVELVPEPPLGSPEPEQQPDEALAEPPPGARSPRPSSRKD